MAGIHSFLPGIARCMTHLSVAESRRRRRDKCSEFLESSVAEKKEQLAQQLKSMNEGTSEAIVRRERILILSRQVQRSTLYIFGSWPTACTREANLPSGTFQTLG